MWEISVISLNKAGGSYECDTYSTRGKVGRERDEKCNAYGWIANKSNVSMSFIAHF